MLLDEPREHLESNSLYLELSSSPMQLQVVLIDPGTGRERVKSMWQAGVHQVGPLLFFMPSSCTLGMGTPRRSTGWRCAAFPALVTNGWAEGLWLAVRQGCTVSNPPIWAAAAASTHALHRVQRCMARTAPLLVCSSNGRAVGGPAVGGHALS